MESFEKLGLSKSTVKVLNDKGYKEPTEIQSKAIPILMEGEQDIIAQSQTGTGKTLCFALPLIEKIKGGKEIKAIILSPTRELALQTTDEFNKLRGSNELKVLTVYGGASISDQLNKLRRGVDIVVGTPGRVIDLIDRGDLAINKIQYFVLDEADEMLNMGFIGDIEKILKQTPNNKRMLLFSATMPEPIKRIAKKFMKSQVTIHTKNKDRTLDSIDQFYYDVNSKDRFEILRRIIDMTVDFHGIIFCKTRSDVNDLYEKMSRASYPTGVLHGEITQKDREKILNSFKKRNLTVLIATDVAARGIDVNDLTHVINYSLPQSPDSYIHRIGRTGRAGKNGIAITFVVPNEKSKLKYVENAAKCKIQRREMPEISDVLKARETMLESEISKIKDFDRFNKLAEYLLKKESALNLISKLISISFKENYQEVSKVKPFKGRSEGFSRNRSNGFRKRSRNRDFKKKGDSGKRRFRKSDSGSNSFKKKNFSGKRFNNRRKR